MISAVRRRVLPLILFALGFHTDKEAIRLRWPVAVGVGSTKPAFGRRGLLLLSGPDSRRPSSTRRVQSLDGRLRSTKRATASDGKVRCCSAVTIAAAIDRYRSVAGWLADWPIKQTLIVVGLGTRTGCLILKEVVFQLSYYM